MFKDEELIIYHNGKPYLKLNKNLILKQGCEKNIEYIKQCHVDKLTTYDLINQEDDKDKLKAYAKIITQLEFKLQELWGFPKDKNFHRFWQTPKCTCPKMDNEDAYPTGYYVISGNCSLHN